ncbi:MAG: hypothetical protein GQ574_10790 [Crocinitomix sp.]|nr:hypothetical protein [Crocinitomix sp.]
MLERTSHIVLLLFCFANFSYANPIGFTTSNRLELARDICELDCDVNGIDRSLAEENANGKSWGKIAELKDLRNSYSDFFDTLKIKFQTSSHKDPYCLDEEVRKNAWYMLSQYFLNQRGLALSANQRYDYFITLPDGLSLIENTSLDPKDSLKSSYRLDSSVVFVFNRHYPTWRNHSIPKIQEWAYCVHVYLGLCEEHFFPFTQQSEGMNCGPTCLKMVLEQFGAYHSLEELAELCDLDESGTSFGDLTRASLQLNITTKNFKTSYYRLSLEMDKPVIAAHWHNTHFVVVYAMNQEFVWVADPDAGRIKYSRDDFCDNWLSGIEKTTGEGSILTFSPMASFYE